MNMNLRQHLLHCETDVEGALQRFCGNEELYLSYVNTFPEEPTMGALKDAVEAQNWEDAFTAAHALKGLAGNLGFVPLYHATGEMVVLLRSGNVDEMSTCYEQARQCYETLVQAIRAGNS